MGEPKDAITYYKRAIEIEDDVSEVFYNLANA